MKLLLLVPKNHHLPMMNNPLPTMVPHHHHTKSNKPKMALPSANTNNQTMMEPISLKQFNRAAADLDAKGEIQLRKHQKYLSNKN